MKNTETTKKQNDIGRIESSSIKKTKQKQKTYHSVYGALSWQWRLKDGVKACKYSKSNKGRILNWKGCGIVRQVWMKFKSTNAFHVVKMVQAKKRGLVSVYT